MAFLSQFLFSFPALWWHWICSYRQGPWNKRDASCVC